MVGPPAEAAPSRATRLTPATAAAVHKALCVFRPETEPRPAREDHRGSRGATTAAASRGMTKGSAPAKSAACLSQWVTVWVGTSGHARETDLRHNGEQPRCRGGAGAPPAHILKSHGLTARGIALKTGGSAVSLPFHIRASRASSTGTDLTTGSPCRTMFWGTRARELGAGVQPGRSTYLESRDTSLKATWPGFGTAPAAGGGPSQCSTAPGTAGECKESPKTMQTKLPAFEESLAQDA